MCPSQTTFPFKMKRIQFPVKLAFAITSNKSQVQTSSKVGIYLNRNCFSHSQLYVAMSRVTSRFWLSMQQFHTNQVILLTM